MKRSSDFNAGPSSNKRFANDKIVEVINIDSDSDDEKHQNQVSDDEEESSSDEENQESPVMVNGVPKEALNVVLIENLVRYSSFVLEIGRIIESSNEPAYLVSVPVNLVPIIYKRQIVENAPVHHDEEFELKIPALKALNMNASTICAIEKAIPPFDDDDVAYSKDMIAYYIMKYPEYFDEDTYGCIGTYDATN